MPSGDYSMVGFRMNTDIQGNPDPARKLIGSANGSKFRFLPDSKLLITGKLGKDYFGDILFNYKLTDSFLVLKSKRVKKTYVFENDHHLLRVSGINADVAYIQLTPAWFTGQMDDQKKENNL